MVGQANPPGPLGNKTTWARKNSSWTNTSTFQQLRETVSFFGSFGPLYNRNQGQCLNLNQAFLLMPQLKSAPKCFTLGVKAEIEKKFSICTNLLINAELYGCVLAPRLNKGYRRFWEANLEPLGPILQHFMISFRVFFFPSCPSSFFTLSWFHPLFWLGPVPVGDKDYRIGSNFWKFYPIRIDFTWGEPASLVKVFRLFRFERTFLVFRVWTE
jgi:hypothetical protein